MSPRKNIKKSRDKTAVSTDKKLITVEILAAVCSILSIFIWISLSFFNSQAIKTAMKGEYITGTIGFHTAGKLVNFFGYSAYLFPILISILIFAFIYRKLYISLISFIIFYIVSMPFFAFIHVDPISWKESGGWIGNILLNKLMIPYLGNAGTVLIFILIGITTFTVTLGVPVILVLGKNAITFISGIKNFFSMDILKKLFPERENTSSENETITNDDSYLSFENQDIEKIADKEEVLLSYKTEEEIINDDIPQINIYENEELPEPMPVETVKQKEKISSEEISVENHVNIKNQNKSSSLRKYKNYKMPKLSILEAANTKDEQGEDTEAIKRTAATLAGKLLEYKIKIEVKGAKIGPVVTMYELQLGEGIKVSQVAGMAQDIGIAVGGKRVRVVPRIPGKPYIGIEVPNENKKTIRLRSVLSSNEFESIKEHGIPIALGETVDGKSMVADLAKMPHLLVAGTTGSGKSVGVNTIIMSILFNMSPQDINFIMIDPKANEFNIYEGIPHMLSPVVTDPKKASSALQWAVEEMECRYRELASNMVRNISEYNAKIDSINKLSQGEPLKKMPYLVVIIDEFADLMTVSGKDVEISVQRIAQKARAAGLHLIIATQRPTRDVITGTIKSNLPVRMAFRVASALDSRTILDCKGAELLLGNGDMLFIPPGSSEPSRVHGAYVSTEEIKNTVKIIKEQFPDGIPDPVTFSITPEKYIESSETTGTPLEDGEYTEDPLMPQIMEYIIRTQKCSASLLQRQFSIGYNRAARIVEILESQGIVSAHDGTSKPRKVLLTNDD